MEVEIDGVKYWQPECNCIGGGHICYLRPLPKAFAHNGSYAEFTVPVASTNLQENQDDQNTTAKKP